MIAIVLFLAALIIYPFAWPLSGFLGLFGWVFLLLDISEQDNA